MNKLHPRLSPWFYVSISTATGILVGVYAERIPILLSISILFAFVGFILKHLDVTIFLLFLLAGYFRARPVSKFQDLFRNREKCLISGEFIVYNEQTLMIPGTSLYFWVKLRDIPHGARVGLKGYFVGNPRNLHVQEVILLGTSKKLFDRSHQKIKNLLDQIFGNYEESALIKALILGDRCSLSKKTKEDFKRSGVAHTLAISGLHINFLFTLFFTLFMFFFRNKVAADVAGLLVVLYYVLTLGPLSPCYRAFTFLFFNIISSWVKRKIVPLNVWGFAFTISVLFNPSWLFEPSFLFSYFSVFGYIISAGKIAPSSQNIFRMVTRYLYAVSIPMVFTLPFQVAFFRYITLTGFVSNLVFLPCTFITIFETILCLLFKIFDCKIYLAYANCAIYTAHVMIKLATFLSKWQFLVLHF